MAAVIVLALLVLTVVVFASERADIGVFSLVVMITLVVTRVLRPEQVFVGLANSAVIMIAGIMIVTGGLTHNGGLEMFTSRIAFGAGRSDRRAAATLYACVNLVSSVINNVAATALFIPLAEGVAKRFSASRAR